MNSRSNGYGGGAPKGFSQSILSTKDIFSGESGGSGKDLMIQYATLEKS